MNVCVCTCVSVCMCERVYWFARPTVAASHKLGGLSNRTLLSHGLEARRQTKVSSVELAPSEVRRKGRSSPSSWLMDP